MYLLIQSIESRTRLVAFVVTTYVAGVSAAGGMALALEDEPRSGQGPEQHAGQTIKVSNALLKTIEATSVAAEVAGKIEKLAISEGHLVKIDEHVGNVRESAVSLQVERAKYTMAIARKKQYNNIDLRLAEKKAAVARNELERAEDANKRLANTYPPKEIARLQLVAASTELEVERAKHDQELAKLEVLLAENEYRQASELLSRHRISSPADGVVVSVARRVGEWVEPGVELFQIVKIDRLRIEGFIQTSAITPQLVGRSAQVIVLKGKEEHRVLGKVVFVSPDANPLNGQVRVFLEIDNRKGLFRPGMRVQASITRANHE